MIAGCDGRRGCRSSGSCSSRPRWPSRAGRGHRAPRRRARALFPLPPGRSAAAALAAARAKLAAATARLAGLHSQAEIIIERYDQTMVAMHQAAVAYHAAEGRLRRATAAQRASRVRVGRLAAQAYQAAGTGGGLGSMAAMLGAPGGPQGFLEGVAAEQQLAQQSTDVLAQDQAIHVVAGVFQAQAARQLSVERAAARRAAALKTAIQAAIRNQFATVAVIQASTRRLGAALGAARAREYELQQARQRALAAALARQQAAAAQAAATQQEATQQEASAAPGPASPGGGWTPGWASGYPLSAGASAARGNIAAGWALSQLGKPYQWGWCRALQLRLFRAGHGRVGAGGRQPAALDRTSPQPAPARRPGILRHEHRRPSTIHHVGIYIGGGQMVDAPYTGANVRIDSIYEPGLIGATRPAG